MEKDFLIYTSLVPRFLLPDDNFLQCRNLTIPVMTQKCTSEDEERCEVSKKKFQQRQIQKNVQTFECVVFGCPKGGMFLNLDGKGDYRDEDGGSVQGSGPGGTLTFYLENSENFEQKVEYKEEKKLSPSIL